MVAYRTFMLSFLICAVMGPPARLALNDNSLVRCIQPLLATLLLRLQISQMGRALKGGGCWEGWVCVFMAGRVQCEMQAVGGRREVPT